MFIFEKNPKNLKKPVEYTLPDGTVLFDKKMSKFLNISAGAKNTCSLLTSCQKDIGSLKYLEMKMAVNL